MTTTLEPAPPKPRAETADRSTGITAAAVLFFVIGGSTGLVAVVLGAFGVGVLVGGSLAGALLWVAAAACGLLAYWEIRVGGSLLSTPSTVLETAQLLALVLVLLNLALAVWGLLVGPGVGGALAGLPGLILPTILLWLLVRAERATYGDEVSPQIVRRLFRRLGPGFLNLYAGFVLVYLFLPVAVIVAFSFNAPVGKFNFVWKGFSLAAWKNPFRYPALGEAMRRSLQIAAVSTAVAVVLGTLVAIALVKHRFKGAGGIDLFLVIPLTTPEIVLGSSLLTLFLDFNWNLGFRTIVLAHIMFQVSFVALTVKARIRGFDWTLEDAAMDLGASPTRTFLRITLPLILPGVVAAAMLSFALSLDDFIITLFNAGSTTTYPLYVNNAAKTALPPQINVLATMVLVVSLVLIGLSAAWQRWRTRGHVL
jgi:spermidine/putrescine transport system permease protein